MVEEETLILSRQHRYEILYELSHGAQGIIHVVQDRYSKQRYALKTFYNIHDSGNQEKKRAFYKEVHALRILHDIPGVIKIHDSWRSYQHGFIVLELCLTSLDPNILKRTLPVEEIQSIAKCMLRTLQAMHCAGIQHNDIKPSNILKVYTHTLTVTKEKYRLCDFGLSSENPTTVNRCQGTLVYIPPEYMDDDSLPFVMGASDVWSLGITLYELAVGQVPFYDSSPAQTMRLIVNCKPDYAPVQELDSTLYDFISCMLIKDPSQRSTIKNLSSHSFVVI